MSRTLLTPDALARARAIRDLSDPREGPHAMQALVGAANAALTERWGCPSLIHRGDPIVTIADNYDRLGYPPDAVARDARYTRYVSDDRLLRTQTSAMIPPLLRSLVAAPIDDLLLVCPGLVYRRDTIDRLHTGEPHQLDLWRVRSGPALTEAELEAMIAIVVEAVLPGRRWRAIETEHPYTLAGRQIDVEAGEGWVEIGECGLAHPAVLAQAGSGRELSGLAMGLGLDRLLMLRKGLPDIRLLRAQDPRIADQLQDLSPWRPVSSQPPIRRALSIACEVTRTAEELGDQIRSALGPEAASVEAIEILSETGYAALPEAAIARMGMGPDQKNVLIQVVLRSLERTLTDAEANALRNQIYAAIHAGGRSEWAR